MERGDQRVDGQRGDAREAQHRIGGHGPQSGHRPDDLLQLVDIAGGDLEHEAADRLGEQRRRRVIVGERVDVEPEAAGDAQLGQGDGEAAFADVVAARTRPARMAVCTRR